MPAKFLTNKGFLCVLLQGEEIENSKGLSCTIMFCFYFICVQTMTIVNNLDYYLLCFDSSFFGCF